MLYPTPSFAAICRMLRPAAFSWSTCARFMRDRGRPCRPPEARAARIPAVTRSRIRSRSSCATAEMMVKSACPSGLLVSMFSW